MSRLMSAADYQREIAEAEGMLATEHQMLERYGFDAASELALTTWQNRINQLKRELEEIGDAGLPTQELSLRFEGRPIHGHSVEVPFIATALRNFQSIVTASVGSAVGRMARSGRFSESLRTITTLRLVDTFQGSFGVHLETSEEQLELSGENFIAEAVDSLMHLMTAEGDETVFEALGPFDARAVVNYRRFLEHLKANQADLEVSWYSVSGTQKIRLTAERAGRISRRLAQFKKTEQRAAWVPGRLDGAIKTSGFFQFITEGNQTISGDVAKSVLDRLREYYDRECEAFVTTLVVTDAATGEVKTWYKLEDLRNPSAEY
jgi:hypothetical protein